ncbi:MAG TPA: efflux RND transporter periplasmic adaptor subunit [Candidatus Binataceae bacterium]|nr:efflux RND transporter periplasmic adaptor subunit [Candidatus Binataceae bacterium]
MLRKLLIVLTVGAVLVALVAAAEQPGGFSLATLFGRGGNPAALFLSGNIEAHESVLSFKTVQSRIVALPFDEGQSVRAGALIARLDDSDYRQNVATASAALKQSEDQAAAAKANLDAAGKVILNDKAALRQATLDYNRYQELWTNHVVSTESRDLAETAFVQARAALQRDIALEAAATKNLAAANAAVHTADENLKLQRIILGYTTLIAPYDGVILNRQAEIGEVMLPSAPVVTLADLDHIWMRAYVNETDIGRVRLGQQAVITTDSLPGRKFEGRISAIASQAEFTPKSVETHAERVTLVYRIKIDIFNPTHALVPGMPVDASIDLAPATTHQAEIH